MKKLTILFLILFFLVACKKKVENEHPEYIGYWSSYTYYSDFLIFLEIDDESHAKYTEYKNGFETVLSGKARANNSNLKVGRMFHFDIISAPQMLDANADPVYVYADKNSPNPSKANWKMVLSGLKPPIYLKGPLTFYKADY